MGLFKYGIPNPTATDKLYQYLQLSGRPRGCLANHNKQTKNEISKFSIPRNAGGLLLKFKKQILICRQIKTIIAFFCLWRTTMVKYLFFMLHMA
jgi:hypothetical protein